MKRKNYLLVFLSFLATIGMVACVNEDDFDMDRLAETHIHPSLENNVIATEFKLSDFFSFESMADEENGVTVEFLKTSDDHDSIIMVLDKDLELLNEDFNSFQNDIEMDPVVLNNGTMDLSYIKTLPITPGVNDIITLIDWQDADAQVDALSPDIHGGERRLDSVVLQDGVMKIQVQALPMPINIQIRSNSLRDENHQYLDTVVLIPANVTEVILDFAGYGVDIYPLNDGSGNFYVDLEYKTFLDLSVVDQSSLPNSCNFNFTLNFGDRWSIDLIYGKMGYNEFLLSDTVAISYFDDPGFKDLFDSNTVDLKSMTMEMRYKTNIGMDGHFDVSQMYAENRSGKRISLFKDHQPKLSIMKALSPTQPMESGFISNEELGGADVRALEILPNNIVYSGLFSVEDNPAAVSFVYPSRSYINLNIKTRIPIVCQINNMESMKNVSDFSFLQEEGGVGDYIDNAVLKFDLENNFPATIDLNIMIKDENDNVVDSLFETPLVISSANVDALGRVVSTSKEQKEKVLSNEKYQLLRNAQKIAVKAVLNSATATDGTRPHVLMQKEHTLKVKMGMKAQLDIHF